MPQYLSKPRGTVLLSALALAVPLSFGSMAAQAAIANQVLPMPAVDVSDQASAPQTVTFAGGCFWGVQAVFQHVDGVATAVSGYAGGSSADADYEKVSAGTTGHAEAVQVIYDPDTISFGKLLQIFFSVALDPTQKNQQGVDVGPHYRSVLFVNDPEHERVARAYLSQLDAAHVFDKPIATRVDTTSSFYPAENYHQDYLQLHADDPYIVANDAPLVRNLNELFPQVWRSTPIRAREVATTN